MPVNGVDLDPSLRGNTSYGFTGRTYERASGVPSKERVRRTPVEEMNRLSAAGRPPADRNAGPEAAPGPSRKPPASTVERNGT